MDAKTRKVLEYRALGLSVRQIEAKTGVSKSAVQRILAEAESNPASVSDSELSQFRAEVTELASVAFDSRDMGLLEKIEAAELRFNAEYGLHPPQAVQAARLRRMMLEGVLNA